MKKRIVWFLCELGLFRLAKFISPSLVGWWRGKKMAEGFADGFKGTCEKAKAEKDFLQKTMNIKGE